ncbi:hypothetical protein [Desulfovirgula thermocuniculi]|uniref:hypothetical protein n=1 Tax=Desulfovirgula thermocuniculi TaxID=348842 RepID=UPI0012EBA632|nr:hypothetical protein [Desulfovirgula thermocuniculi]
MPEKDNGLELLHCFARVAPYINQLAPEDTAVAVATREKYLAYVPGRKKNLLEELKKHLEEVSERAKILEKVTEAQVKLMESLSQMIARLEPVALELLRMARSVSHKEESSEE